jgi:outer membrane receptor protein involved in Fe transport
VIDETLEQTERTYYGELIYDRSFFTGRGLFTGGVSYRHKKVDNAPVWSSYLPDFLGPDNEDFLPLVATEDYQSRLWSAFGQYTHRFGDIDLMLGLRYDDHDQYKDHLSFSGALGWTPNNRWIIKLLYGTAYRTPFARQLISEDEPDLERISTLSTQAIWKPSRRLSLSAVGFYSELENHIVEDPYAGLSLANEQDIYGMELEVRLQATETLELAANLTLMDNSGPDETYELLTSIEIDPDTGEIIPIFEDVNYPYNPGAKTLANLMATWHPFERVSLFGRLGYFSSRRLVFPRTGGSESASSQWLLDASATLHDLFFTGSELSLTVTNLLDERYETPGTYSFIDGRSAAFEAVWRIRW